MVLLFLYGTASPIKVDLFETWMGLMVALLFVTLPFSVRAVQPVLASLDGEAEAAAKSLGAGGIRTFIWVVLPSLWPAVLGASGWPSRGPSASSGRSPDRRGHRTDHDRLVLHLQPDPRIPLDERRGRLDGAAGAQPHVLVATNVFARRIQHRLAS